MINDNVMAVVLAHNPGPIIARCLDVLLLYFPPERIIVGDNGTSDGSLSALPNTIRIERFGRNLGYCAGTNRLFRLAQETGAEIALSVNPDATIEEEDANKLISSLKDADVAMAHPRILREGKPGVLDGAYGEITWRHFAVRMLGEGAPDGAPWDSKRLVAFGHGACYAANLRACLEVGGFDEDFFAYQDEADLGLRLKKRGYLVSYVASAKARHLGPSGDGEKLKLKRYFLARNSVLLVRKHGLPSQKLKFLLWLTAAGVLLYLPRALLGDRQARMALAGWYDGLRKKRTQPVSNEGVS